MPWTLFVLLLLAVSPFSGCKSSNPASDAGLDADADGEEDGFEEEDLDCVDAGRPDAPYPSDAACTSEGVTPPVDGQVQWVTQIGHDDCFIWPTDLEVDLEGNIFITGYLKLRCIFGLGECNEHFFEQGAGSVYDIFIAKLSSDGTFQWVKTAGGRAEDKAWNLEVLGDGTLLISGFIGNQAIFGAGEPNETTVDTLWPDDSLANTAFLARYARDGALMWAKRVGGLDVRAMTSLSDGTSFLCGHFGISSVFAEGQPEEFTIDFEMGSIETYLVRYDPDGRFEWFRRLKSDDQERCTSLASTSDGGLLVGGQFKNSLVIGVGLQNEIQVNQHPDDRSFKDGFIARFEQDGSPSWAYTIGGPSGDSVRSITATDDGGFAFSGDFWRAVTFDLGGQHEFGFDLQSHQGASYLIRYSPDNGFSGTHIATSTGYAYPGTVDFGCDSSLVGSGVFIQQGTIGDLSADPPRIDATGEYITYAYRMASDGTLTWVKAFEGHGWALGVHARSLGDGSSVVAGTFKRSIGIGRGDPAGVQLECEHEDIFLVKLGP